MRALTLDPALLQDPRMAALNDNSIALLMENSGLQAFSPVLSTITYCMFLKSQYVLQLNAFSIGV